jgi:hypothetical protein
VSSRRWLLSRLPWAPVALAGSVPMGRQVTQLPPGYVAVICERLSQMGLAPRLESGG